MLLEARGWALAGRNDAVLSSLTGPIAACASAETHSCAVELRTRPHVTAAAAASELADVRCTFDGVLRSRLGLRAAVAGTHPFASWEDVAVSSAARYRRIHESMRALARREPTFALHVHVAVPDAEMAVRALDGLRADLPLLLALSANSPFWQGRDTGLASTRTPIFSMFPRVGIPRCFGTYAAYVRAVEVMRRSGAVADPSFLWWDARLQPGLGTVEVRIMDAQTRACDTAALIGLVQCLVRQHAEGMRGSTVGTPEALVENRFLAARDGMQAELIDPEALVLRPVRERLVEVLDECAPFARELGCRAELQAAAALAADPGHLRQRSTAARRGLRGLLAELAAEFVSAPPAGPTAPPPRLVTAPPD
jgi:glutamate---cysteine ligase / carboxylate-amine ligase